MRIDAKAGSFTRFPRQGGREQRREHLEAKGIRPFPYARLLWVRTVRPDSGEPRFEERLDGMPRRIERDGLVGSLHKRVLRFAYRREVRRRNARRRTVA